MSPLHPVSELAIAAQFAGAFRQADEQVYREHVGRVRFAAQRMARHTSAEDVTPHDHRKLIRACLDLASEAGGAYAIGMPARQRLSWGTWIVFQLVIAYCDVVAKEEEPGAAEELIEMVDGIVLACRRHFAPTEAATERLVGVMRG